MSDNWVADAAEFVRRERERERGLPILGSPERPYVLIVPPWLETLAQERGGDLQDIADDTFRVAVKVEVYRG